VDCSWRDVLTTSDLGCRNILFDTFAEWILLIGDGECRTCTLGIVVSKSNSCHLVFGLGSLGDLGGLVLYKILK
jgi:hypothetical protein